MAHENGTPYFEEANTVLVCRKLYAQPYDPASIIAKSCDEKWYPNKDYHMLFFVVFVFVFVVFVVLVFDLYGNGGRSRRQPSGVAS